MSNYTGILKGMDLGSVKTSGIIEDEVDAG